MGVSGSVKALDPCDPAHSPLYRRPHAWKRDEFYYTELNADGSYVGARTMTTEDISKECLALVKLDCSWFISESVHRQSLQKSPNGVYVDPYDYLAQQSGALRGIEDKPYTIHLYMNKCALGNSDLETRNLLVPRGMDATLDSVTLESFVVIPDGKASTPAKSMQQRAVEAFATMRLPDPQPLVSLGRDATTGRRYTVPNGYTWFAAAADSFRSQSKRVDAGQAWVEVTATPVGLRFSPGGDEADTVVSCQGRGQTAQEVSNVPGDHRPWWTKPPASDCWYRYTFTSPGFPDQPLTATLETVWQVTWVGSGHSRGTLPETTTGVDLHYAVTELQTLVTR